MSALRTTFCLCPLKEDNVPQTNCQNQLSHPGLSHTRARMSGVLYSRKDLRSKKFGQRPQIFLKLSFRELCNSKLSGLYAFNMVIIH